MRGGRREGEKGREGGGGREEEEPRKERRKEVRIGRTDAWLPTHCVLDSSSSVAELVQRWLGG